MPKLPARRQAELDSRIAAWDDFLNPANWGRSRKGNLWREFEGATLTVFSRRDGLFGWSIADHTGPQYSPDGFETEDEALEALADELGVMM